MYCWFMRKRNKSLIFTAATVILLVILCQISNAKEKDVKPSVRIELIGGQTKTLSSPLRINGKFKTEKFVISYLPIEKLESLVLAENKRGDKNYILKLRGTKETIRVSLSKKAEIYGSGEWGKESIAISRITSLYVTNVADSKPFKPVSKWQCTFTNGKQLIIGWDSKWSRDREFSGQIGAGSLNLDTQQVNKLTQNAGKWVVASKNGFSIEGWQPKQKLLSASSPFGGIEILWVKIAKLVNESVSGKDLESKHKARYEPDWKVKIEGGFVLPVKEMQVGSNAKINDELDIKTLSWNFVYSTTPKSNGLQLNFTNKKSWVFNGEISANSPVGKVQVSSRYITELSRLKPPPRNVTPSNYDKKVVGRITTVGGAVYSVASPSLIGGNVVERESGFWGNDLISIRAGASVEFWIGSSSLLSDGFAIKNSKILSRSSVFGRYGQISGFQAFEFINPAGQFSISLSKLVDYSLKALPPQSKKRKRMAGKYRITVKDAAGKEFTAEINTIEFARRPETAWSGSYYRSSFPLQWHKANILYFKKHSGERMDVEFDKLSRIEIIGRYQNSRQAMLTSTQGSSIKGSIYPGDVTKSYPGVAEWDPYREGLLCKMTDGTNIYVPFREGTIINIQSSASQK